MLFLILGVSVSAPVGLLCIQRTLSRGRLAGFFTGFGAATANLIYASIAAFGFSVVSTFLKKSAGTAANIAGETLFSIFQSFMIWTAAMFRPK